MKEEEWRPYAKFCRSRKGEPVTTEKLVEVMVQFLRQFPAGLPDVKLNVLRNMGNLHERANDEQMEQAWQLTLEKVLQKYPRRFKLDRRKNLIICQESTQPLDQKITVENFQRLNKLADKAGCTVNTMVTRIINAYERNRRKTERPD